MRNGILIINMASISPIRSSETRSSAPISPELQFFIDKVKNCFRIYQENSTRDARKKYITALHETAKIVKLNPLELDEVFVDIAEKILRREAFVDCSPRLIDTSINYLHTLRYFENYLVQDRFNALLFKQLISDHNEFIAALSPEYTAKTKNLIDETPTNFPHTLQLFRDTLKERISSEDQWKEWKNQDVKLMNLLPKYALCRLISLPDLSFPELADRNRLASIRSKFRKLESSAREKLLQNILGQDSQIESAVLYQEIISLGSEIHLENRQIFSNILLILTKETL